MWKGDIQKLRQSIILDYSDLWKWKGAFTKVMFPYSMN